MSNIQTIQEAFNNKQYTQCVQESFAVICEAGAEVKTTQSGLRYIVLQEGAGAFPSPTQSVTVHYHGQLENGKVFDSSYQRGQNISFGLNQVIRGWTEMLGLMQPGSTVVVSIPSDLAYGARGAGGLIGPNMPLLFLIQYIK
jgi:FKBP-type peptidyl-prolyl cis-trans isomerase FkpA